VIVYFLGGLGAFLGPLFGIVMADYWLLRKQRINVPELYTTDPRGTYFYSRGINLRAIGALIPSAGISLVFAFTPSLQAFSAFSWFIAAALGGVIYFVLADRSRSYEDVSGEAIAVESSH
jgi:NCS1 family nucleobase:cation symporter-1